jgi:hypothetical protein
MKQRHQAAGKWLNPQENSKSWDTRSEYNLGIYTNIKSFCCVLFFSILKEKIIKLINKK